MDRHASFSERHPHNHRIYLISHSRGGRNDAVLKRYIEILMQTGEVRTLTV
jgi:hypothetical protein